MPSLPCRLRSAPLATSAFAAGLLLLTLVGGEALAQTTAPLPPPPRSEPFQIMDNSFLVEEAFNQPPGIVQNIVTVMRIGGAWDASFTQEWPAGSETHQLSYTAPLLESGPHIGLGDVLLNYRYQASTEGPGRPAFSPRASVILPTGRARRGLGDGSYGVQFNLPVSKQTGEWQWHGNGGLTWLPAANDPDGSDREESLTSPFVAGSAIYRLRPMLYLMLESLVEFEQTITSRGTDRETIVTMAPGIRGGWNMGEHQLVIGVALPIARVERATQVGAFFYLSYELPF